MEISIFQRLEQNVSHHPDKTAFLFPKDNGWDTLTYQQLLDSTNRFASALSACSLTSGMRALLMTPPSIEFFPFALALLKLGIVPIMIDPAIGLKKLGTCINETQPDIFIGNTLTHTLRILFGWGRKTIKYNLTIESVKRNTPNTEVLVSSSSTSPASPVAIIFTSGSTGAPKGVLYSQGNFIAQLEMLAQTFNITSDEIDLPAFPLYALIDVLLGVTSVIPDVTFPVPGKTNPEKVLNAIHKFNVTNMFASPVVLDILSKANSHSPQQQAARLQSLKRIITAGAPATIPLQEKFRKLLADKTDLFGTYGATETLPIAKVESRELFALKEKSAQGAGVCLGKPIEGVHVRIIQITDAPIEEWQETLTVEKNVVGEITVQSAATTRVYIQREEATRLSKIKIGADVIHRTGDVGYFDEHGRLWYCGRKSQRVQTKYGIFFTEQIEGILNTHPSVYRTALVGVNQEPILWVETIRGKTNQDTIKRDLLELAKQHPQASKIQTILFMKKFPTDVRHNSKIIREELTLLAEKRVR
ncbi:MAG: fatty acid CoA ligase family protein [Anaerolineales bacterium]